MSLAEISQIAAALGTIASILYAAVQIRSNSRAVRASAIQHFVNSFTSHWDEMAREPELSSLFLRGTDNFESLDRLEKLRFRFALTSLMRRWENVWNHLNDGTRKDSDLPSTQFQEAIVSAPGFYPAWELIKIQSGTNFTKHIDRLIERNKAAKANIATEKKAIVLSSSNTKQGLSKSPKSRRKEK